MAPLQIVLVPAASALPRFYKQLIERVEKHGFEMEALHIPSVGPAAGAAREGRPPTMDDDAVFVAAHVTRLADDGKDVLLMAHSYGGTPASQSIKGLAKSERAKMGKPGGVVGLAYMTCLVPELGKPASVMVGPAAKPSDGPRLMEVGSDGWLFYPDIARVAKVTFSDLPQEEGEKWAKELAKHSAPAFAGPLTYAGYNDVPVSYLVCEGDQSISAQTQRAQIEMIERESGNKVDVTSIPAGHAPTINALDDVVAWLVGVAQRHA